MIKQKYRSWQVNLTSATTDKSAARYARYWMYFGGLYRGSGENRLICFRSQFMRFHDTISLYEQKTLNNNDRGMLMEEENKLLCRIEYNSCVTQFIYVYSYLMFWKKGVCIIMQINGKECCFYSKWGRCANGRLRCG